MTYEDFQDILAPITKQLQSIGNLLQPQKTSGVGEVLIDRAMRIWYPYLTEEGKTCAEYFEIKVCEIVTPIGLLLLSKVDGKITAAPVKNRTESTLEAATLFDLWLKTVHESRDRAETLRKYIDLVAPDKTFVCGEDDKFFIADDDRAWDSIEEAIASAASNSNG